MDFFDVPFKAGKHVKFKIGAVERTGTVLERVRAKRKPKTQCSATKNAISKSFATLVISSKQNFFWLDERVCKLAPILPKNFDLKSGEKSGEKDLKSDQKLDLSVVKSPIDVIKKPVDLQVELALLVNKTKLKADLLKKDIVPEIKADIQKADKKTTITRPPKEDDFSDKDWHYAEVDKILPASQNPEKNSLLLAGKNSPFSQDFGNLLKYLKTHNLAK